MFVVFIWCLLLLGFILLIFFLIALENILVAILFFDSFANSINPLILLFILFYTLQPCIFITSFSTKDKKSIFIKLTHFFLLSHVKGFDFITKILYLLLQVFCHNFFAMRLYSFLEVLLKIFILGLFFVILSSLFLFLPQKPSLFTIVIKFFLHDSYNYQISNINSNLLYKYIYWTICHRQSWVLTDLSFVLNPAVVVLLTDETGQISNLARYAIPVLLN